MATDKSVQGQQIQHLSAPRAEARGASMSIPRRDLLAVSALALLGSVGGCAKSTPASSGRPTWVLRTQFMDDFTDRYIGDPTKILTPGTEDDWPGTSRKWPKPGQLKPAIVQDYAMYVNVLMAVGYVMVDPNPPYPSGSPGEEVLNWLKNTAKWPIATPVFLPPPPPAAPAPLPPYQSDLVTVHLLEIAVILDRLMQAINSFNRQGGPGGGPSSWPPH